MDGQKYETHETGEVRYGGGTGEGEGVMASVCYLVNINIKTNSGKTSLE